jgi:hypothetical protein
LWRNIQLIACGNVVLVIDSTSHSTILLISAKWFSVAEFQ